MSLGSFKKKIVYQLTVEDLQTVAQDILDRCLNETEIELIRDKISDQIDWYEAISNTILINLHINGFKYKPEGKDY